jgi:hypothetical protein
VHEATAAALDDKYGRRFQYFRRGPDFVDTVSGAIIELTTPGQLARHASRYGDLVKYVTYVLPT